MKKHIFLYGFSIFSMFFGSGNLVFPLMVGAHNSENWLIGFLGFFLTGIILPFLGLFVIKLHKGNYSSFFNEAGSFAKIAIPFFTLSLLGSFGVIPRCITVAHGGLEFLFNEISLTLFSTIFCIICYFICLNEQWMFKILGKLLTPILLLFLAILFITGIYSAPVLEGANDNLSESFSRGFFEGYETMDLFAAFFFSSLIFKQIEAISENFPGKSIIRVALGPSIFGAILLSIVYFGFVHLGAHYSQLVKDLPGELMLPAIANHLLGKNGALFIAIIMILSCLTTAVALNSIYAKYWCQFQSIGIKRFKFVLFITTFISFIISLRDFEGIAAILSPLLIISYPGLIFLTIISIFTQKYRLFKKVVFYLIITILAYI